MQFACEMVCFFLVWLRHLYVCKIGCKYIFIIGVCFFFGVFYWYGNWSSDMLSILFLRLFLVGFFSTILFILFYFFYSCVSLCVHVFHFIAAVFSILLFTLYMHSDISSLFEFIDFIWFVLWLFIFIEFWNLSTKFIHNSTSNDRFHTVNNKRKSQTNSLKLNYHFFQCFTIVVVLVFFRPF